MSEQGLVVLPEDTVVIRTAPDARPLVVHGRDITLIRPEVEQMSGSRLEITTTGPTSHGAVVRLDGIEIQNALRGLNLSMAVDKVTCARVELDVYAVEVTQAGVDDVQVLIPEGTRELLIRAGWTPPQEHP